MNINKLVKSERGLTLIEIMVVLIILAIVMAFLGNRLIGQGDKAKARITTLKMKEIQTFIEQFNLQYNKLPAGLEELTACSQATGEGCIPITNEEQLLDAWNNKFLYASDDGGRGYRIKSLGADGKEGGTGVDFDVTVSGP